eukprot:TRINITY_DN184_c2_g1_i1.p1 TRINITY_DN184_c2_g1~~TRINITY_DN184_c2_g1_i1.p1  ORF type:complete len:729 (-),score=221.27 TRINITY_DN184_c2_g1_i1:629-2536(-)
MNVLEMVSAFCWISMVAQCLQIISDQFLRESATADSHIGFDNGNVSVTLKELRIVDQFNLIIGIIIWFSIYFACIHALLLPHVMNFLRTRLFLFVSSNTTFNTKNKKRTHTSNGTITTAENIDGGKFGFSLSQNSMHKLSTSIITRLRVQGVGSTCYDVITNPVSTNANYGPSNCIGGDGGCETILSKFTETKLETDCDETIDDGSGSISTSTAVKQHQPQQSSSSTATSKYSLTNDGTSNNDKINSISTMTPIRRFPSVGTIGSSFLEGSDGDEKWVSRIESNVSASAAATTTTATTATGPNKPSIASFWDYNFPSMISSCDGDGQRITSQNLFTNTNTVLPTCSPSLRAQVCPLMAAAFNLDDGSKCKDDGDDDNLETNGDITTKTSVRTISNRISTVTSMGTIFKADGTIQRCSGQILGRQKSDSPSTNANSKSNAINSSNNVTSNNQRTLSMNNFTMNIVNADSMTNNTNNNNNDNDQRTISCADFGNNNSFSVNFNTTATTGVYTHSRNRRSSVEDYNPMEFFKELSSMDKTKLKCLVDRLEKDISSQSNSFYCLFASLAQFDEKLEESLGSLEVCVIRRNRLMKRSPPMLSVQNFNMNDNNDKNNKSNCGNKESKKKKHTRVSPKSQQK